MKKLFLFTMPLLCLFVLTFTSCNNDDDAPTDPIGQLPPMTQTGENTFGCLINGEPLIVSNTIELTAIYQGGVLQLGGGFENNITDKDITINIEEPLNINVPYDLTNYPVYIAKFRKIDNNVNCNYDFENTFEGFITLSKFDQVNFIVSGTFEFSTTTEGCDTIRITNGRFDLKYIP